MTRLQPQNGDAERAVIGACLQSPTAVTDCLQVLAPDHFYGHRNRLIFSAIREIAARDEPVDIVTVLRQMEADHCFDTAPAWEGGAEQAIANMKGVLTEMIVETTHTSSAKRHAAIVKEMWGKRYLIEVLTPPMTQVWNGAKPDKVIRDVEDVLLSARCMIEDDGQSRVISAFDAAAWMEDFVRNPPDKMAGVAAPFTFLDRHQPGELHVLGGYPKDGKTAVMGQFIKAPMLEAKRIGVCSVEMSWQALTTRIVSTYGVPYKGLQQGFVGSEFRDRFTTAIEDLAKSRIDIIDDAALTAQALSRYQKVGRYDFIVIDYLQLLPYTDRLELNAQLAGITRLARQANIPILLLSQFSRPQNATQGNPFPRPTMASFAETSKIEKDASMCMAIWRKRDETGQPTHEAELIVLNSRYSEPTSRTLHFRGDEQRFVEVDWRHA